MKNRCWILLAVLISCSPPIEPPVHLGQGTIVGGVDTHSAIFQTRLTASDTLIRGDLPGIKGIAKFEISTQSDFSQSKITKTIAAVPENDFIIKTQIQNLTPNTQYHYRVHYGKNEKKLQIGSPGMFMTLAGAEEARAISFAVVTGMNHYRFHYGDYDEGTAYPGEDKPLGYPALAAIAKMSPQYFVGTGDNVYFDHPNLKDFQRAVDQGKEPHPGGYDGAEVVDEAGMRQKYHQQFVQPRFKILFSGVGTYWEKDDHDYRDNDSHPSTEHPISHELGVKNFREQLPVVDPENPKAKTYRTFRMSRSLQIWLVEGRDYRSANDQDDGPEKSLWGAEQRDWLKQTLAQSDATFKILISPTPMVGPDDVYKADNHTNPRGFRYEGDQFFSWLQENGFPEKNFYIICGDRHWQYHARHPSGIEEFSCGALVDNNSRAGRVAGDPDSTDPEGNITQLYIQSTPEMASGGFLLVQADAEKAVFSFFDERGKLNYREEKKAK